MPMEKHILPSDDYSVMLVYVEYEGGPFNVRPMSEAEAMRAVVAYRTDGRLSLAGPYDLVLEPVYVAKFARSGPAWRAIPAYLTEPADEQLPEPEAQPCSDV